MLQYLVIFGACLQLFGIFSYIKGTIKGTTKPNRVTWILWAIAPMIATIAALSEGVSWAVLPTFMAGFGPLLVFIASFINKRSYWKLTKTDYTCGAFSILALILWGITKDANIAILFAILSDLTAGIPTLIKSWKEPKSESAAPFLAGLVSTSTSFFAITMWSFAEIAFPIYLVAINIVLILTIKRQSIFTVPNVSKDVNK